MPISTVLFDMDGLIFDTEGRYKLCWQAAASEQGFTLDDAFYQGFIGVQDAQCEQMLLSHFGSRFDLPRFRRERDQQLTALSNKPVDYKPGFEALFQQLIAQNYRLALVTSSSLPQVRHHFADSPWLEKFEVVISAEDIANGKPAPDCYLLATERLGVTPAQCMVLEDSNNGMRAGIAAGCQAVMVPDLLKPDDDVRANAMAIVSSLLEVPALLR
ncbi:HAD family hydrolase [Aliagarivorans taiwanensis]|uniref:HAD family hydrolase n=1 Tax=Aliagarivorans taiwanensis TaxID=561966 RepID=UPI0004071EF0|nr:HAD family phosphatase [Aliagarivorans taiwanensis]